mgnify:CR=1 FL=1
MELQTPKNGVIGTDMPVRDAALKVTGQFKYVGDMTLPHMLHAKVLFSPVAHARIKSIDTSQAEQLEGVRAVVCWKNAPDALFNSCGEEIDGEKTERVFDSTVRYVGDKVAAVAAETAKIAEQALKLIRVEYEELPYYLEPEDALKEGAYPIHKDSNVIEEVVQEAGDVEKGMAEADYIYEDDFETPAIHHGAIETHTSLAVYESSGKLTVYTPSQDVFGHRTNLSRIFGLPMSRIRVVNPGIGGGFGGKIDMVTEPVTALLAMKTGRPVRLVYTRREDIPSSRNRHSMKLHLKTGMKKDGTIVAQEMDVIVNAGAYAGGTMSIVWAMSGKYFKNHKTPNLRFHAVPVYTNTPVAGAMRGFGSPQEFFAQQCQLNRIAKDLGMDIIQLQLKNLVEPDGFDQRDGLPHGNPRPIDCVLKGMELSGYEEAVREQEDAADSRYRIGVGMAVAAHGNGVFGVRPDTTGVIIKMNEDGTAVMFTGVSDMGNGSVTTQTQVVSEILGIPMSHIECVQADTDATLWDMGNYSSRGTYVSCNAAVKAAGKIRQELLKEAAQLLEEEQQNLELKDNGVCVRNNPEKKASLEEVITHARKVNQRDICCADTFASYALAMSYGAHFVKVSVDTRTGGVKVLEYTAVHDVGKALNPMSVEGQIEGAVQMGLGYALSEGIIIDSGGKVKNTTFKQYHIMNAGEMPPIKVGLVEETEPTGPYGAKSIGECSVVPSAGAIANAVANAIGCEVHRLPLKPDTVLELLARENETVERRDGITL